MKLKVKIIIFAAILFFSGIFSVESVQAGTWGEDIMAEEMGQMQTALQKIINGVIMGAAKQAAVKAIEGQISNIVSGGGSGTGGAKFITNWEEHLFKKPAEKTQLIMKDFLTNSYGGRSSSLNYISASGGSYTASIEKQMKELVGIDKNNSKKNVSLDELGVSDPMRIFSDPSKGYAPFAAFLDYNSEKEALFHVIPESLLTLEQEQKKAEIQAIAYQGFLATTEGGSGGSGLFGSSGSSKEPTVTTPGIITKEIMAYAENMSGQTVVTARDIPEVITALVTKIVTKTITDGIGKASQNAQRNNSSTGTSNSQSNNASFGIFGNFGR
jgi:hypothetical protein